MKKRDCLYPGRIISKAIVSDYLEEDAYLLYWNDENENNYELYLIKKYIQSENIEKIQKGKELPFSLVIIKKIVKENFTYLVAIDNYYNDLKEIMHSDISHIPWISHWETASINQLKSINHHQTRLIDKKGWAIEFKHALHALIPVNASKFLSLMKYKHYFYPNDLSNGFRSDVAVYRPQTENYSWPHSFKCTLKLFNRGTNKSELIDCHIILHGILDPIKNHLNIRKHVSADRNIVVSSEESDLWYKCLEDNISNELFQKCPVDIDNKGHKKCPSKCEQHQFKEINESIMQTNEKYLKEAVTFFKSFPTHTIYTCEHKKNSLIEVYEMIINDRYSSNYACLFLKGIGYHFKDNYIVHMHIITMYQMKNNKEKHKKIPSKKEKNILKMGKIIRMEEVKK